MSNVKIVLDREGVGQLLKSEEAKAVCADLAQSAMATLGEGHEVSTYTGKSRVNATISAVTFEAIGRNMKYNTLIKSLRRK